MERNKFALSRKDIIKLIEEYGGNSLGLDLSGKRLLTNDDYSNLNLQGIILSDGKLAECNLEYVNLTDANLRGANLERINLEGAILNRANLEEADLVGARLINADLDSAFLESSYLINAHLEKANLIYANLKDADLSNAYLEGVYINWANIIESSIGTVNWGNYIIGEEKDKNFSASWHLYRHLKNWYSNNGYNDIAGEFFYREMEVKRKLLEWKRKPFSKLWSWVLRILCGYGERPERVVISAVSIILGLALIYFIIGTLSPNSFLNSIYYSFVSFTALGYGSWAPEPSGWVKGLGAFESFIGVFNMALFLVTFTRKMTR